MPESAENFNKPPLFIALLPMIILVAMLSFNVLVYRDDALSGSNQMISQGITAAVYRISLQ